MALEGKTEVRGRESWLRLDAHVLSDPSLVKAALFSVRQMATYNKGYISQPARCGHVIKFWPLGYKQCDLKGSVY